MISNVLNSILNDEMYTKWAVLMMLFFNMIYEFIFYFYLSSVGHCILTANELSLY